MINSVRFSRRLAGVGHAGAMDDVVKAPSLFKTLDVLAKSFKGLRGMVGSLEDVIDGDVPLGEVYELAASFRGRIDTFVETIDGALKRAKQAHAGHEHNGVVLATFFKAKGLVAYGCDHKLQSGHHSA